MRPDDNDEPRFAEPSDSVGSKKAGKKAILGPGQQSPQSYHANSATPSPFGQGSLSSAASGVSMLASPVSDASNAPAAQSGFMNGNQSATQGPSPVINSTTPNSAIDPVLRDSGPSSSGAQAQGGNNVAQSSTTGSPPVHQANQAVQPSRGKLKSFSEYMKELR